MCRLKLDKNLTLKFGSFFFTNNYAVYIPPLTNIFYFCFFYKKQAQYRQNLPKLINHDSNRVTTLINHTFKI